MTSAFTSNLLALQSRIAANALTTGDCALLNQALGEAIPELRGPSTGGPGDQPPGSNEAASAAWLAALYTIGLGVGGSAMTPLLAFVDVNIFPGVDPSGVADSSAAVQAAVNSLAGSGQTLWFPAGTYRIASPITVPSLSKILGEQGQSIIKSTITPTAGHGGFLESVFLATGVAVGAASTLAATPVLRSNSLSSNASFPVGSTILVTGPAGSEVAQQFTVKAVSGAGPYTLTTDDPIMCGIVSGNAIQQYTVPTDIVIDGLTGTGTGDRFIELGAACDCIVRNCNVNPSAGTFSSIVISFDLGGRRNLQENITIDQTGGNAVGGAALESNFKSVQRKVTVYGVAATSTAAGIFWPSAMACEGTALGAFGCYAGMLVPDGGAGDAVGPIDCAIDGGAFIGNTGTGFTHAGGRDCQYVNVRAHANGTDGFDVNAGGATSPTGIQFANVAAESNGAWGLNLQATGGRCECSNLRTALNVSGGALVSAASNAELTIDGFESVDDASPWSTATGSTNLTVRIHRAHVINLALNGLWYCPPGASGLVVLEDYTAEYVAGTGTKVLLDVNGSAVFCLSNVRSKGVLTDGIVTNGGGCTIRLLHGINLRSCTTPLTINAADYINRGTVVANGVTAVPVAFPDMQAAGQETVKLTSTGASAVGDAYVFSQTAGTGFSIKSEAGDANTYEYEIS